MAKVPGIWREKPKVSEAELQADRRRTEKRLAAIFGLKFASLESDAEFESDSDLEDGAESVDDMGALPLDAVPAEIEPEEEVAPPVGAVARPRPAIFVEGSRDLVPVMATVQAAPRNGDPREDWDEVVRWGSTVAADEGTLVPEAPLVVEPEPGEPVALVAPVAATLVPLDLVAQESPADPAPEPEEPVAPLAPVVTAPAKPKAVAAPAKAAKPMAVAKAAKPKAVAKAAKPKAVAKAAKPKTVAAPMKAKAVTAPTKPNAAKPKAVAAPAKSMAVAAPAKTTAALTPWCPSCAIPLEPVPTSSRRCPQCRERIIVKRVEGHTVFLAKSVLPVFEAERRRVANASRLARECQRWLRLAAIAGAPAEKLEARARSAVARPSEEAVAASRVLYLGTVERAYHEAKRERRWEAASRIRRDHALVLYREAGSPVPPPDVVLKLHRDVMAATLRGIAEMVRDAELVAAACCDTCLADDRRIVRISAELREPSLPHEACPKGLCGCRWDLPTRHRATVQRYVRRRSGVDSRGPRDRVPPTG